MFKHYVTAAIRLIKRSLLFSTINMLGFILGISAAFLIYLWIVDEMTFEDFNKNRDSIYRVIEITKEEGQIVESAKTMFPLAKVFRDEFSSVRNATNIKHEGNISLHYEDRVVEGKQVYVDEEFFNIFSFPVVAGNPEEVHLDPQNIVISESYAKQLFGNESPIGKQVKRDYFRISYHNVVGVVKVPRKSHTQFDVVCNTNAYEGPRTWNFKENITTYIQLNEHNNITGQERTAMSNVLTKHMDTKAMLYFQPITQIHLNTGFIDSMVSNYGSKSQIYLFSALAILIIFMGAFNFTTLSTAQSSIRYKEVGVRKVTGAKRKTLILQFLSESTVQALISLILALALTELLLPLFNQIVDKDITLSLSWQVILFVFLGIFGVGCLAGSYPAFFLSAINPLLAFKGGQKTGKKGGFIKGLVCVQFVIAIALVICTSIVYKQLNYIQNQDLGYDKENIISINTNLWYDVAGFKQEVLKNPKVLSVSMGVQIGDYLKGYRYEGANVVWENDGGAIDSMRIIEMWGESEFIETFNIKLIKGKTFETDFQGYWEDKTNSALINETAWKRMNVADPIGLKLRSQSGILNGTIIGVVEDFNFQPLREPIKPMIIRYNPEAMGWLHIRIAPEDQQATLKYLEEVYTRMSPPASKVFAYKYMTDTLNRNYERERQQGEILLIFTILAIIIAMMGVFGLVSLSTQQRTKEIGVRKVIGAHTDKIVRMFCMEYSRWLLIAFVIASPIAYLLMNSWLGDFAYRTTLSWWIFPLAALIIYIITLITVVAQTYRVASQNPITSLRYE